MFARARMQRNPFYLTAPRQNCPDLRGGLPLTQAFERIHAMTVSRRNVLKGATAFVLVPVAASAAGLSADVDTAMRDILNGREVSDGEITLDLPRVAENGGQVPISIQIDSPMSAQDHVRTIHVVATRNPVPHVGQYHLTPHMPRAEMFTRIRLAEDQTVIVLADLSDGRVLRATAKVAVTAGGCAT